MARETTEILKALQLKLMKEILSVEIITVTSLCVCLLSNHSSSLCCIKMGYPVILAELNYRICLLLLV